MFPPGSLAEMDGMDSLALIESLKVAAAQSSYFFAAGARRVQMLVARSQEVNKLLLKEKELVGQVATLEGERGQLRVEVDRVAGEKMVVEEKLASFEEKFDGKCKEFDVVSSKVKELEGALEKKDQTLAEVTEDLSWVMKRGLAGVVDQVLDCSTFTMGIHRIKQLCTNMFASLSAGDGEDADARAGSLEHLLRAIDDMVMVDYAAVLQLGRIGVPELRTVCHMYDEQRTPDMAGPSHSQPDDQAETNAPFSPGKTVDSTHSPGHGAT